MGLELAATGEDVLRTARSMADTVQAIIEREGWKISGRLNICARKVFATCWPARRMSEFLALQTYIRVFPKVLPSAPNLLKGDGDMAIRFEEPHASSLASHGLAPE